MSNHLIIAIDGPAGAGKSTVSKALAKKLDILFLDTGAMYRAVAWHAMQKNVSWDDIDALVSIAQNSNIEFREGKVFLNDTDVSEAIRTVEVTNNTKYIATPAKVREVLVAMQQEYGQKQSLIAEGRDVTTVVFVNATYKFYLDADVQTRAERRLKDFKEKNIEVDFEELKKQIQERDQRDQEREVGALKKADDAIMVDCSGLDVDQTVEKLLKYIK